MKDEVQPILKWIKRYQETYNARLYARGVGYLDQSKKVTDKI